MNFSGAFKLSSRAYRARPLRTFLTIFGISIGISAVLLLVSLGYGLQEELLRHIITSDTLYTLSVRAPQGKEIQLMSPEQIDVIQNIPGIAEVSGTRLFKGSGKIGELNSNFTVSFFDESYLRLSGARLLSGDIREPIGAREVVMTIGSLRLFAKDPEDFVGKQVEIRILGTYDEGDHSYKEEVYTTFIVRGIIQSEDNIVYMPFHSSERGLNAEEFPYSIVQVRMDNQNGIEDLRSNLVGRGYDVSAIADIVRQIKMFFLVVQFILGSFGVVALFVSAIGMFNTMTVTLFERTQEIGIMKSIGATDRYISVLFVMESFLMGILGGLLGIIIAFIEMAIVNGLVNVVAMHFGGESVDLFFTPVWFIVLIFIFSGMVGIITGLIPAKRASALDTLTALQYK